MDRLSDSDSDDDETYRRLGSRVLRPAISSLPSIGDEINSDGGDSSSETEVVFSNINWAAQDTAGLLYDQEPTSPGLPVFGPVETFPEARHVGAVAPHVSASGAGAQSVARACPDDLERLQHGGMRAGAPASSSAAVVPSMLASPSPPGPPAPSSSASGDGGVGRIRAPDPDEPYEGRGWLAGAAGRLANTSERRRVREPHSAATDEEQVAAAASHAAALRQERLLQQQRRPSPAKSEGVAGDTSGPGAPWSLMASPRAPADDEQVQQQQHLLQQQDLQREREVEQLILQDFQEAIQAAESEPPLVAPAGLSLQSTVAGLAVEDLDLDALIARLAAGTAELSRGLAAVEAAAEGSWPLEDLPAADSLWSDEEGGEGEVRLRGDGAAASGLELPGTADSNGIEVCGIPRASLLAAPATAAAVAGPAAATAAMAAPGPAVAVTGSLQPPTSHLPGPLPAKFKSFVGPGWSAAVAPLPPPLSSGSGAAAGDGAGGPVVQDLRHSITEVVLQKSRYAAAAAAQRQSQAKAAAARRRLADSSSEGGSCGEGTSSDDDDAAAVKKVRPVPPTPPTRPAAVHSREVPPPTAPAPAAQAVPRQPPAAQVNVDAVAVDDPLPGKAREAALVTVRPAHSTEPVPSPPSSNSDVCSAAASEAMAFGATAVEPVVGRSVSVGTDSADLGPASRSVFVCTTEHQEEEQERLRDIREYLKARAAVATAAAAAEEKQQQQQRWQGPAVVEERRWPEPPAAVKERIAAMSQRQTAPAAPKPVKPRAVATFSGDGGVAEVFPHRHCGGDSSHSGGECAQSRPLSMAVVAASVASASAASMAFAACSTEGDEDLLAEPPASSVTDARTERGARMAAAGTVISLMGAAAPIPNSSSSSSSSKSSDATGAGTTSTPDAEATASKGHVITSAALTAPARASSSPALGLAVPEAPASSAGGRTSVAGLVWPSALQLPSPTASPAADAGIDQAPAAVARVPPLAPSAAPAATAPPPARSPGAGPAAPADLYRLPAWLPQTSCFTLLLTSPGNLTSREVGAALEWLLSRAAAVEPAAGPAPRKEKLPPFSVVGARLLAVPSSWPHLPSAAAAARPCGGGGDVRVLAVACVPRTRVDADAYSHELPATLAADAAAAANATRQLAEALAAVPLSAVMSAEDEVLNGVAATRGQPPRRREALSGWISTLTGAQLFFSPLRLPPHAFSQPRASGSGAALSPGAAAFPGSRSNAAPASSSEGPGAGIFVSMVTAGVLRNPRLMRGLMGRAACLGLTLRGLQVVYASEEAAAVVVASTPHRPVPHIAAAVLALSGHNEPMRRWQAALGPPDVRLACRTDPSSLHALYGDVARHITCSYDSVTAARELSALFAVAVGGDGPQPSSLSPSPAISSRQQSHHTGRRPAPSLPSTAPQKGSAAAQDVEACGLGSSRGPESQWLALPAAGASQQSRALWCLQHLLWCGYGLRGLLLMRPPGDAQQHDQQPALVLEVSNEEAADQLPLLFASVPPLAPHAAAVASVHASAAVHSLLAPDMLQVRLAPSDVQGLPQPYVAEQLLVAAAGSAVLDPAEDNNGLGGGSGGATADGASGGAFLHLHHGEDGIAVVALQARPLHAAALLLATLTAHATGAAAAAAPPSPDRLELVACRYVRQVPSDVANCLVVLHPHHASGAAAAAAPGGGVERPTRTSQRVVISHPALLAVFHGPAAQSRIARWLAAALQRLHRVAPEPAGAAAAAATSADGAWDTLLSHLFRDYALPSSPPVVALSSSQAAAKRALSYAFSPAHVFLDAGLHDGLHRPQVPVTTETAASSSPLFRLLSGPELLPAVVALDFAALHRNLLPRLLKQLWREGYVLHGAATGRLQPGSAAAAAMPALSGQPAVLLHVSRSNAVQHLRAMTSALAAVGALTAFGGGGTAASGGGGGAGGGLFTCDTWRDAVAVVADVWPETDGQTAAAAAAALGILARRGAGGSTSTPARRFVRPEGARLLQLTAMVVAPSLTPDAGNGAVPSLDWARLADALEALHSEGFRLAAVRATAVGPRDLADLGRVSCRIAPAQQHAIHTSAAAAAATAAAAAAGGRAAQAASNVVLLALARDSAVTSLQLLLDEAGRAVGEGARHGAAPAQGVMGALAGRGPGRREAVAALAALAPCVSVSHSPAAAEQQIAAVFDDVYGAGGVPLLQ